MYSFGTNMFTKSYVDLFQAKNQNFMNGAFPVKYDFTLKPMGRVAKGAIIEVELPPQIKPSDIDEFKKSCYLNDPYFNGFSYVRFTCEYNENNNTVFIIDGFKLEPTIYDPPTLKWTFDYLSNPRGLVTSDMFNCTIFNKDFKVLF
jgi:hypothetical protein